MVFNPLSARAERKTSRMLTRVGWEPPQTWPVARAGEPPLVFQTRLPAAEFVPAAQLLAQAERAEDVFLAAAICSTQGDHGVLATMTAALAAQPLPFLDRRGVEQGRRARKKVNGMLGRVTMIERLDGDASPSPLVVQYAIAHRYGTLTLTFVAHGSGLAGNARRLFQNIVRGCHLGTEPLI